MRVVMTLVVRDEADIVGDQIRYHLDQGVDFVVATDHRSADGTTDVLRSFERDGQLLLIREDGPGFRQSEWVTRMARLAVTDFDADWVIHSDADEFWWPRRGPLKNVLAAVPARFGVVRGIWRNFVLRPDGDAPFYERMTLRRSPATDITDPYHAQVKIAHRAHPNVVVPRGNHDALGEGLLLLREWFPFEVLHFPIRSHEHLFSKYEDAEAYRAGDYPKIPRHIDAMASRLQAQQEDVYRELLVDDVAAERGLAGGTLTLDTRLRDAMGHAHCPGPTLADDAELAAEVDTLLETDASQRLSARAASFERRLAAVEARRLRLTAR